MEDGRDHSKACITCEEDGFTARRCGPKTLPGMSLTRELKRQDEEHTGEEVEDQMGSFAKELAEVKGIVSDLKIQLQESGARYFKCKLHGTYVC